MTGTNPGTWPDQWHGDEDDGKAKARTTGAIVSIGATKNCFTAADMKAVRLETVERVMSLAERAKIRPFGYKDETVYEIRLDFVEKLKEEIENEL